MFEGAVVGHLVGDFLIQNDWMAQNKKKAHWPCLVHVTLYTIAVMLLSQWPWWIAPIVFIPHYLIDRWGFVPWYMRKIGQTGFMTPPSIDVDYQRYDYVRGVKYNPGLGPWSSIVVDNTFHLLCLYLTSLLI